MSSRKGGEKPFLAGTAHSSSPQVDQLTDAVANASLDNGEWEVYTRKSKNRAFGGSNGKLYPSTSSSAEVWGHPAAVQELRGVQISGGSAKFPPGTRWPTIGAGSRRPPLGRGNISRPQSAVRHFEGTSNTPSPRAIALPLEHGWNWSTRAAACGQSSQDVTGQGDTAIHSDPPRVDDDNDNDSDVVDTDDEIFTDEDDSDVGEKSHDSRIKSKWFKVFFENLDKITLDDVHNPSRRWHCPACQGGPGGIDWYRGMQPLMTHAKTKGSRRVKLHREFAELLDEELRRKGTSVISVCETFGKWKGLDEKVRDRSIVWPPMVVIMNTKLEQDENDKWIGMGNQELLDSFSSYSAFKARHAYGPQGHRGMSVLIFENSAMGFLEAERLHNHFQEQGTDRDAWDRSPVLFYPGGKRQLYGYLAEKQDLDLFNRHCGGNKTAQLKFEMRSYQEMVVNQLRQMSEDNQQLIWLKDKVLKEKRRSKALEESFQIVSEKLRKTVEENQVVRQRSRILHEQKKEEMDSQEQFFKEQLEIMWKTRDAKEDEFEQIQQEEREKKKQSSTHVSANGDCSRREEDFAKFVQSQDKRIVDFLSERDKLDKAYEEKRILMNKQHLEMNQQHLDGMFQLEKDYDAAFNQLVNKYITQRSEQEGNSRGL